ncbi:MAG: (5-formylfuran-3-yl)methyl phosphate synthase [Planctomycetota bacterium]
MSVRNADEVEAAIAGGAAIIDVKEPGRGPMGAATPDTISTVIEAVAGRRPVTAAAGELVDADRPLLSQLSELPLSAIKLGLANQSDRWPALWADRVPESATDRFVPVAYADHAAARSPRPKTVFQSAAATGCGAIVIDTWQKHPPAPSLVTATGREELAGLLDEARSNGLVPMLAGRLDEADLTLIRRIAARRDVPAIAGVRGAACDGGRNGRILRSRVERLVAALRNTPRAVVF